ncbi:hypothetical protein VP01_3093g2 [Puccinia sorghi]|uniref:Reverse transcriptase Ty1/copia-type domain-containing protein n=1 Tax=Puccinia sorghi TaxID=27349 RepID=A0A0L6UZI8_9BASI|nr:hypothetical protein VP01_3093g2 [Puccinia sorghi]
MAVNGKHALQWTDEEIYIKNPEGSKQKAPYLKLEKSSYGLKQAPKNWYNTFTSWFKEINYVPSAYNVCLFIQKDKDSFIFFHVNDMIVIGRTEKFQDLFLNHFPNSTAHNPDTLLGMKLITSSKAISLSQPTLIKKGLEILDLVDYKPFKMPTTPAIQLHTSSEEDHQGFLKLNVNYRTYTAILNYLACRSRPDLASAVCILSRFNQGPDITHWKAMLHFWKYLKGTQDFGLILKPDPALLSDCILFYTDAMWAEDQETRILQSGSIAFQILPKSVEQQETDKYHHVLHGIRTEHIGGWGEENQWLTFLIKELWKLKLDPTLFHVDNCALMEKLNNFWANSKTKHLDIQIKNLRYKYKKQRSRCQAHLF